MKISVLSAFAGFATVQAVAFPPLAGRAATLCNADNCLRAVRASSSSSVGSKDCVSYLGTATSTVAAQTLTITSTISTPSTLTASAITSTLVSTLTVTTVLSATSIVTVNGYGFTETATQTQTISSGTTTVTTTYTPNAKRQVAATQSMPKYASVCSVPSRYLSACSCIGVTAATTVTTVAAQATTTISVTVPSLITSTPTISTTSFVISTTTVTSIVETDTVTFDLGTTTTLVSITVTVPAATSTVSVLPYFDFTLSVSSGTGTQYGSIGLSTHALQNDVYPWTYVADSNAMKFRLDKSTNNVKMISGPYAGEFVYETQTFPVGTSHATSLLAAYQSGIIGSFTGAIDPTSKSFSYYYGPSNVIWFLCGDIRAIGLVRNDITPLEYAEEYGNFCGLDPTPVTLTAQILAT